MSLAPPAAPSPDLRRINHDFYEALWAETYLVPPKRFNTWPLVALLLPLAPARLEIGAGLRPRLPVASTHFIDLSPSAVARLNALGGLATVGDLTDLPFPAARFDLVAAFDVIEHVADDQRAFHELARVLKPGGILLCSVPLHTAHWTSFDACVGHARRYDPATLRDLLAAHGFTIEQSAVFGMQPNHPRLLDYGVRMLTTRRRRALRWYNRVFMPLGLLFQKRLRFTPGLLDTRAVHEVALVCRRSA